jgi:transcriptional regulator with GAF, ATPase, and Fis domain
LKRLAWPGNVRELDNLVQRVLLLAAVADEVLQQFNDARAIALSTFERQYLLRLMHQAQGNVSHAARMAGKERRALGKLLKKHCIDRSPPPMGRHCSSATRGLGPCPHVPTSNRPSWPFFFPRRVRSNPVGRSWWVGRHPPPPRGG